MLEKPEKLTDEETEELVNEPKFSRSTLLQEIEPLLKEYFICIVDHSEEVITMSFLNGQKFAVTANEIMG